MQYLQHRRIINTKHNFYKYYELFSFDHLPKRTSLYQVFWDTKELAVFYWYGKQFD